MRETPDGVRSLVKLEILRSDYCLETIHFQGESLAGEIGLPGKWLFCRTNQATENLLSMRQSFGSLRVLPVTSTLARWRMSALEAPSCSSCSPGSTTR
ncbi:hypothetical protein ANOBCDAF_04015 [Pleomorphomonas sp. T1.2MG-36]|nr:hypothetical protein ANOBCDAF_04015 [Pleomorphomonas sp. T1.2MG-36]